MNSGGGRKTLDPMMEERLHRWILSQQEESGDLLTRCQIKNKAKEISNVKTFKASKGWLDKFKKRFGIKMQASTGESQFAISETSMPDSDERGRRSLVNQTDVYNAQESLQVDKNAETRKGVEDIYINSNKTQKERRISKELDIHDFLNFSENQN